MHHTWKLGREVALGILLLSSTPEIEILRLAARGTLGYLNSLISRFDVRGIGESGRLTVLGSTLRNV